MNLEGVREEVGNKQDQETLYACIHDQRIKIYLLKMRDWGDNTNLFQCMNHIWITALSNKLREISTSTNIWGHEKLLLILRAIMALWLFYAYKNLYLLSYGGGWADRSTC